MEIKIFKELATNDYLDMLDKESESYTGLHVDMNEKEQRKFVKDKASLIGGLIKKLDRSRVDVAKEFRDQVETEFSEIKTRLERANAPFINLINEHKEKRAKILADEKAKAKAIEDALQKERDHADAITMDKIRTFEIEEEKENQKRRDEGIAREARAEQERLRIEAEERAEEAEKQRILAEAKAKRDAIEAEKQRVRDVEAAKQDELDRQEAEEKAEKGRIAKLEANKKHVGKIRKSIKEQLMSKCNIDEPTAKSVVLSLIKIDEVTINY